MTPVNGSLLFDYFEFGRVLREKLPVYPSLVGYYEAKEPEAQSAESLQCFLDFFAPKFNECHVFSSLTESEDKTNTWGENEFRIAKEMNRRGWFQFDKTPRDLALKFAVSSLSGVPVSVISESCQMMFSQAVHGYFFLIWPGEQLMAYPHINEGFGFVAKSGTRGEASAKKFLKELVDPSSFTIELMNPSHGRKGQA